MFIPKTLLISLALFVSFSTNAQTMSLKDEFSKKIKAANTIEPQSGDLFGNNTNPSTGKTEFSNIDISLVGNSELLVQLGRRLNIDHRYMPEELGGLGNWDLDVPYIEGTFSKNVGWAVSTSGANRYMRCSSAVPPALESVVFSGQEVWHGYKIHVPGILDETMLAENNAYPDPADGLNYPWILKSIGRVGCLPTVKNGYSGEGYFLKTTDGRKYYFDYPVERKAATLYKAQKGVPAYSMERKRIFMLATRIEDRFGNFINYGYSNGRLVSIVANDGRRIDINYGAITNGAQSGTITAIANAKVWSYIIQNGQLVEVKQPDGNGWKYSPFGSHTTFVVADPNQEPLTLAFFSLEAFCDDSFDSRYTGNLAFNITHPSGAVGQFTFEGTHFFRSQVPYQCAIDFFDHQVRINLNDMRTSRRSDGIDWGRVFSIMDTNGDNIISGNEIANGNLDFAMAIATDQGPIIDEGPSFAEVAGHARIIIPNYFALFSLKNLNITGTGIGVQSIQYNYNSEAYPYCDQYNSQTGLVTGISCSASDPCPEWGCTDGIGRWVEKTLSSGQRIRQRFGVFYGKNEGELLAEEIVSPAGAVVKRIDYRYLQDNEMAGQPFGGSIGVNFSSDPSETRVRPVVASKILQQGVEFNSVVTGFNNFAMPVGTTKSSSLGYTSTDNITYGNNLNKWILGQVKTVTNTNTNKVVSQTNYDAVTALPVQSYSFGLLQNTMSYNPDGTLSTVKDAKNNTVTLSNYKRGIPQNVSFADGTGISAVVNDSGWVTSVADQLGSTTSYEYDLMGRLRKTLYPVGDTNAWQPTNTWFRQQANGVWANSVWDDRYAKATQYDAMWRPTLQTEWDWADGPGTQRQTSWRYDTQGRVAFQSYPYKTTTDVNTLPGIHTEYDALGRVTKVKQDSELGQLTTTTEYLAGFQTKVTNPKGVVTRQGYQVFDAPDTSRPVFTVYAEGTAESKISDVIRDVFGKATYTQMRNPSSSQYFGRSYVFDANERLNRP